MYTDSKAHPGLIEIEDFGENPGNLAFFLHPGGFDQNESLPRPLVIALHGCNQSAGALARTSDWNKLADQYAFYVIYPEQKILNNQSRCFNWFKKKDYSGHIGEVESIHQMVEYMKSNYLIDERQIFVYGLSAGAAMSVAYMANYPDEINSGAIFAGSAFGMAENGVQGLKAMRNPQILTETEWMIKFQAGSPDYQGPYPKLIALHGSKDRIVHFINSFQLVKQFVAMHRPLRKEVEDEYLGINSLTRMTYLDSNDVEMVTFYKMKGLVR